MTALRYAAARGWLAAAARDNTPVMVRRAATTMAEIGRAEALCRLTIRLQKIPMCGLAALAADALLRLAEQTKENR